MQQWLLQRHQSRHNAAPALAKQLVEARQLAAASGWSASSFGQHNSIHQQVCHTGSTGMWQRAALALLCTASPNPTHHALCLGAGACPQLNQLVAGCCCQQAFGVSLCATPVAT